MSGLPNESIIFIFGTRFEIIVYICTELVHIKKSGIMLVISSREFRANQKTYLDKIDEGTEILIQRGRHKSYKLVPVTENDTLMSKEEFIAKIDLSLQQIAEGKFTHVETKEELQQFLKAL